MGRRRHKMLAILMSAAMLPFVVAGPARAEEPVDPPPPPPQEPVAPPPPLPVCAPGSLPIRGLLTQEKVVTFTFDDGPSGKFTPAVMRAFEQRGLTATFFVLSQSARHQPALVQTMIARGFEVGNHSRTHHYNARANAAEIPVAQADLSAITGVRPLFFRNPGLNWSKRALSVATQEGLCAISTDVYLYDWLMPRRAASTLCSAFRRQLHPGSIVLMHDGGVRHGATVRAVPCMLDYAIAQGYRVLGLRDFLALAGGDPARFVYAPVKK